MKGRQHRNIFLQGSFRRVQRARRHLADCSAQPTISVFSSALFCISNAPEPFVGFIRQTELEKEKTRKDGGDSTWIERTRRTEAELDWAKEMADRLDRVNQGLSRENVRLKSQFKSQEDDRKFLIKQLVAIKVRRVSVGYNKRRSR